MQLCLITGGKLFYLSWIGLLCKPIILEKILELEAGVDMLLSSKCIICCRRQTKILNFPFFPYQGENGITVTLQIYEV